VDIGRICGDQEITCVTSALAPAAFSQASCVLVTVQRLIGAIAARKANVMSISVQL